MADVSNPAQSHTQAPVILYEVKEGNETSPSVISHAFTRPGRLHRSVVQGSVARAQAEGRRLRVTARVPFLRTDHVEVQESLPGMWKVLEAGQLNKLAIAFTAKGNAKC